MALGAIPSATSSYGWHSKCNTGPGRMRSLLPAVISTVALLLSSLPLRAAAPGIAIGRALIVPQGGALIDIAFVSADQAVTGVQFDIRYQPQAFSLTASLGSAGSSAGKTPLHLESATGGAARSGCRFEPNSDFKRCDCHAVNPGEGRNHGRGLFTRDRKHGRFRRRRTTRWI